MDKKYILDKLSQIDKIQSALREISDLSRDASDLEDEFSDAYYRLEDTMRKTRKVVDSLVYSEEDIDGINDRLDTINSLKKKLNLSSFWTSDFLDSFCSC